MRKKTHNFLLLNYQDFNYLVCCLARAKKTAVSDLNEIVGSINVKEKVKAFENVTCEVKSNPYEPCVTAESGMNIRGECVLLFFVLKCIESY